MWCPSVTLTEQCRPSDFLRSKFIGSRLWRWKVQDGAGPASDGGLLTSSSFIVGGCVGDGRCLGGGRDRGEGSRISMRTCGQARDEG